MFKVQTPDFNVVSWQNILIAQFCPIPWPCQGLTYKWYINLFQLIRDKLKNFLDVKLNHMSLLLLFYVCSFYMFQKCVLVLCSLFWRPTIADIFFDWSGNAICLIKLRSRWEMVLHCNWYTTTTHTILEFTHYFLWQWNIS